jgi:AAA family ATP:ADP antiporter
VVTEQGDSPRAAPLQGLRGLACRLSGAAPHELSRAYALFLYNFLVITAYLIVKPVRNSLFLDRLGADALPYAYIGTALFVGGVVWIYFRLLDRLTRTQVVVTTWTCLGLGLVAFWFGFRQGGVVVSALFYFFSAAFAVMGVTQFWSFASEVLDPRQGRRLFGFVQAGGIVGGLAGGLLTRVLAPRIGTEQLLFVSAALCFSCAALAGGLSRAWPLQGKVESSPDPGAGREEVEGEKSDALAAAGGFALVRGSRYLLMICGVIFCFQMVSTLVDYQFMHVLSQGIPTKDQRTAFLGTFFVGLNLSSLVFQFFATTRIHTRYGLGPSLVILPVVSLLGSAGFFLWPVFWMGCGLRGAFGALDYSLDRATRELLYLPTSREVKYKAKAFIDMFCFRFFRCLAGILILALGKIQGLSIGNLSLAVMAVALGWLVVARVIRGENIRQLRLTLTGSLSPVEPVLPRTMEQDHKQLVEIGYELQRLLRTLQLPEQVRKSLEDRSGERLEALAAARYGPSDVPLALQALRSEEPRRALGLELLDGLGDTRVGMPLFRILDRRRSPKKRLELLEALLVWLGELPQRKVPREVWVAARFPGS